MRWLQNTLGEKVVRSDQNRLNDLKSLFSHGPFTDVTYPLERQSISTKFQGVSALVCAHVVSIRLF